MPRASDSAVTLAAELEVEHAGDRGRRERRVGQRRQLDQPGTVLEFAQQARTASWRGRFFPMPPAPSG